LIAYNTIQNNYYYGIVLPANGTAMPEIIGNTFFRNGEIINGAPVRYGGIAFDNSRASVRDNTFRSNHFAILCDNYASPESGNYSSPSWQPGANFMTENNYGVIAYTYSTPTFGLYDPVQGRYYGACNHIYGNAVHNVHAGSSSTVYVQGNWWGSSPPDPAKFYAYGGAWINYEPWLTTPTIDCQGGGFRISARLENAGGHTAERATELLLQARLARVKRQYALARALYQAVAAQAVEQADRERGLVGLFDLFRDSNDHSLIGDVEQYRSASGSMSAIASELLMSMYTAVGRYADARALALSHKAKATDTRRQMYALIQLASLGGFAESERAVAGQALRELREKFGSTVDAGLLAALGTGDVSPPQASAGLEEWTDFALSNYPNPFNPSTVIRFTLSKAGHTSLKVFDLLGREVAALVNEYRAVGSHQVLLDASTLPSGMYFYRLESGGRVMVQKMVLAR
jgi:hypothetical protein